MKGFDTQEVNTSSIEDWTLLQCKEYLDKYPKGLKSEQIRKHMSSLQIITGKSVTSSSSPKKEKSTVNASKSNQGVSNNAGSYSNASSAVKKNNFSVWDILGPILVALGLIVFTSLLQFTEWWAALGIYTAAIYGIYSIYNYFSKK